MRSGVVDGWADAAVFAAALRHTILAVLPALFLFTIWRYHVSHAGVDELTVLPFGDWNWTHLSDMAAMGATPRWALLAGALPDADPEWLDAFARGFFALADAHGVELVGGDTTRGPLTLTVTIMGEVPMGAALRRNGAKAGHDVWVSGNLGDAALAVAHRHGKLVLSEADYREAVMRLYEPTPRVALGQALRAVTPEDCRHCFQACGYHATPVRKAL